MISQKDVMKQIARDLTIFQQQKGTNYSQNQTIPFNIFNPKIKQIDKHLYHLQK